MPQSEITASPQPEVTTVTPRAAPLQAEPIPGRKESFAVVGVPRMKAIVFDRYGEPNVLEAVKLPTPVPVEGDVLVRVTAIGVNPADVKWRSGMFEQMRPLKFPYVPGYDIAARVESGPGFAPGTPGDGNARC